MAFQLSPGVNVTEKDLTTIVPAVATTNAGFVGLFNWGPVNQRILVDSENNLVQLFGTPDDTNAEWWFCAANFLGYGNNLQVVRGELDGMINANGKGFTGTTTSSAYIKGDNYEFLEVNDMGSFVAKYPGVLGNTLEVQVCGSKAASGTSGLTTYGGDWEDWQYADQFDQKPNTSTYVTERGGSADEFHIVVVDRYGKMSGVKGNVLEKFEGVSVFPGVLGPDGTSKYYVDVINRTSKYIAAVEKNSLTSFVDLFSGGTGVWGGSTAAQWYADAVSLTASSSITGNTTSFGVGVWQLKSGNSGVTGVAGVNPTYVQVAIGNGSSTTAGGYYLFDDSETVDVNLIIGGPEYCWTGAYEAGTDGSLLVGKHLKDIADKRKDCVAFLSVPNKDPNETDQVKLDRAVDYRNAIGSSSYVFIDSGYKYQYDIYNDKNRWVPLNGDIAGLCARTDLNFDPWYSPAGLNRGQVRGVIKLAFQPRQAARDTLYKNNINPVATFTGEGTVLYGDKTAQAKPSAFDRINVRRLFIVLEKAIATAAKYSLFEFNDAFTRSQFRSLVEPFLRDVQARRGLIDFKVVCDERNNTPEVIDSNRFVADIYIKPNRSINFIQLNFVATRTGVNFSEVGA
jgi:hypothetical protein